LQTPIVDLHCHFLPGIDDGPATMGEAIELAQMAVDNGITHAVVTPHLHPGRWENTRSVAVPVFERFKRHVEQHGIPLALGLSCEARLDPELLQHLNQDELPFLGTLNGERVMLLELPHGHIPLGADRFAERLIKMGIRPMIAHPERNKEIMRNRDKLAVFEELGCLFQITAGSLLGKFGRNAEALGLELLESTSAYLIASDAHNTTVRVPELLNARDIAAEVLGQAAATAMISEHPWRIAAEHFADYAPADEASTAEEAAPAARQPAPIQQPDHEPDADDDAPARAFIRSLTEGSGRLGQVQVASAPARTSQHGSATATQPAQRPPAEEPARPAARDGRRCLQSPLDIKLRVDLIRRLAMVLPDEDLAPLADQLAKIAGAGGAGSAGNKGKGS
jgi:protein-tyrosine phosphatase